MNFWEAFGLYFGLTALGITVAVGIYDLSLWLRGKPTISEQEWAKLLLWQSGQGPFPWLVLLLPLGVSMQAVGLLIHLLAGLKRK